MAATIEPEVLSEIREVTDEEVGFFAENGWVMLREFYSRDLAAELLRVAREVVEPGEKDPRFKQKWDVARLGIEPFPSIAWGSGMGQAAHRLVNRKRLTDREVPTRALGDVVWGREGGCKGIAYHQDSSLGSADRIGFVNMWVALDEVTPEMGAMRFVTGSHREGPLGIPESSAEADERGALLAAYPKLLDLYEWSPPFHYQPGDATVHQGWTIHGSPTNETDRERWSYISSYAPADTRYRDGKPDDPPENRGTTLSDDTAYPVVYPPAM
jgi:hypothetical protein